MSDIGYRKLLYEISKTLDNSFEIEILRYMCRGRISLENEDRINNALELFDELEREGHLGIDNLDVLKDILRELEELGWLRVVIEFVMKRNELREPRVGHLKTYITIAAVGAGVGAVAGAAIYKFCTSTPTFFEDFTLHVLVGGITLIDIRRGSLCFNVQAENLSALKALWDMYQDGTLQNRLQEFLVTEEIKKLADGKEVEVTVSIDEQEYKDACLDLKIAEMEASRNKELSFTARRRNSDSSISLKDMETEAMRIKLNQSQKKLQLERERTRALEKEIENPRAKLVATRSVGIQTSNYGTEFRLQTTEPTKEATVGVQYWKEEEEATTIEMSEAPKELDLERKRARDVEETSENPYEKLRMRPTTEDTADLDEPDKARRPLTCKREASYDMKISQVPYEPLFRHICMMLEPRRDFDGKDYRMLARELDLTSGEINYLETRDTKTYSLLMQTFAAKENSGTLNDLVRILKKIGRYDVVEVIDKWVNGSF